MRIEKILTDIMSPTTMSPTWTWVHIFVCLLCFFLTILFVFLFEFYLFIRLLLKNLSFFLISSFYLSPFLNVFFVIFSWRLTWVIKLLRITEKVCSPSIRSCDINLLKDSRSINVEMAFRSVVIKDF